MRDLQIATFEYYEKHGQYPVNQDGGTWFEFLKEGVPEWFDKNYLRYYRCISDDGKLPLDLNGFAFVYQPPSDPVNEMAVIRSIGENGVDEGGEGDDWDIRYGPNLGYWYKSDWPALYRWTAIWTAVGIAVTGLILLRVLRWWEKIYAVLVWVTLLMLIIIPWGRDPFVSTAHYETWFYTVVDVGYYLLPINLIATAIILPFYIRRRWGLRRIRRCRELGLCLGCGYDLRGTLAAGRGECPECGEVIGDEVVGREIEE